MAKKRMFNLDVVDTDLFLEMPISARLLYYELGMRADDDGFVSSPKKIMKMIGVSEDDIKVLTTKGFIIPFKSGVVVITHWKLNNYIQSDRRHETMYTEELKMLDLSSNGTYFVNDKYYKQETAETVENKGLETICIQNASKVYTKNRLDKIRLDKNSIIYSPEKQDKTPYKEIIEYLNLKTNKHYKYNTKKTQTLIKARINEGFTLDDFKIVIDNQTIRWLKDKKMCDYLRPETLFGNKFEGYLNNTPKEITTRDLRENIDFSDIVGDI